MKIYFVNEKRVTLGVHLSRDDDTGTFVVRGYPVHVQRKVVEELKKPCPERNKREVTFLPDAPHPVLCPTCGTAYTSWEPSGLQYVREHPYDGEVHDFYRIQEGSFTDQLGWESEPPFAIGPSSGDDELALVFFRFAASYPQWAEISLIPGRGVLLLSPHWKKFERGQDHIVALMRPGQSIRVVAADLEWYEGHHGRSRRRETPIIEREENIATLTWNNLKLTLDKHDPKQAELEAREEVMHT